LSDEVYRQSIFRKSSILNCINSSLHYKKQVAQKFSSEDRECKVSIPSRKKHLVRQQKFLDSGPFISDLAANPAHKERRLKGILTQQLRHSLAVAQS